MKSLVSIIIPTYYRNDSLRSTIKSALDQTYEPIEIIVVDDSGEEHARPVAEDFDVIYLAHQTNKGQVEAWNTGVRRASGDYVQLLDDDDVISPEKINKQEEIFRRCPSLGVVYAGVQMPDGRYVDPKPNCYDDPLRCALQIYFPGARTSSLLIRKDVLEQVVPIKFRDAATDVGLRIELAKRSGFDYVDENLTYLGEVDTRQSASVDYAREVQNILREYRDLYEKYPPGVRRGALSYMYEVKALHSRNSSIWSSVVIKSYLKAAYYTDGTRDIGSSQSKLVLAAMVSLLGRPGLELASKAQALIRG